MPWTTIAVVFGSWALLLALTVLHFVLRARARDDEKEGDER
jgi:hypothetical protein